MALRTAIDPSVTEAAEWLVRSAGSVQRMGARVKRFLTRAQRKYDKATKAQNVDPRTNLTSMLRLSTYDQLISTMGHNEWSADRSTLWNDLERIYNEGEIVSSAIDANTDAALGTEMYDRQNRNKDARPVRAVFTKTPDGHDPIEVMEYLDHVFERAGVYGALPNIAKNLQLHGDEFRQIVTTTPDPARERDMELVELQHIPNWTMWPKRDPVWGVRIPGYVFNDGNKNQELHERHVIHFVFRPDEYGLGRSLIFEARYTWSRMNANEEALMVSRFLNAHPRLVHNIPVEEWSEDEEKIERVKYYHDMQTTGKVYDQANDKITRFKTPISVAEDIYNPVFVVRDPDGKLQTYGGTITPIEFSNPQSANLTDMEFMQDKIMARLATPRRFLNMTDDRSGALTESGLQLQDMNYARKVRAIQRAVKGDHRHGLRKLINILLLERYGSFSDFEYHIEMAPINLYDERDKAAVQAIKINSLATVARLPLGKVPMEYVMKKVCDMTEQDWLEFQEMRANEIAETLELMDILAEQYGVSPISFGESGDRSGLPLTFAEHGGEQPQATDGLTSKGNVSSKSKALETQSDTALTLYQGGEYANDHPLVAGVFKAMGLTRIGTKNYYGRDEDEDDRDIPEDRRSRNVGRRSSQRHYRYAREKASTGSTAPASRNGKSVNLADMVGIATQRM